MYQIMKLLIVPPILIILVITCTVHAENTFKVFILAGQSNMVGQVQDGLIEHQAKDPKTAKLFAHLRKDGQWVTRDDVFIKFGNKHGGLTKAYGSRGKRTGLELEYGTTLGEHFKEPVLLIKTSWGGHSLFKNFRPPSAGLPEKEQLKKNLPMPSNVSSRETKNTNATIHSPPWTISNQPMGNPTG